MRIRAMGWLAAGLVFASVLAACGSDDNGGTAAGSSPEAGTDTEQGVATVATADSDLGTILVDADGNTLYRFENDEEGTSTCYGECEATWPPLAADDPTAGGKADQALVATTERKDDTLQVTYDGHPLYTFSGDAAPGDTNGQELGDVWYVVSPDGEAVEGGSENGADNGAENEMDDESGDDNGYTRNG
jgi:predicted lipoprotein with Yx(FWY)xxD motif